MIPRPSRAALTLITAIPLLTGCLSVLPEQPTPQAVYRMADPVEQVAIPATLVVREPDAPRLLASRRIASQGPQGGYQIISGVAWADRATRLLQVTMIDSFSAGGAGLAVDDATGVSGTYELYWRLLDFNLDGGEGVCRMSLTLMDGGSREPIAQHTVSARVRSTATGAPARARALAETGRDCVAAGARRIAEDMTEEAAAPES